MGFSELELEEAMGRFDDGRLAVLELPGPSFCKVLSLGDPTRSSDCLAETASFLLIEAMGARFGGLAIRLRDSPPLLLCGGSVAWGSNFRGVSFLVWLRARFASWRDPSLAARAMHTLTASTWFAGSADNFSTVVYCRGGLFSAVWPALPSPGSELVWFMARSPIFCRARYRIPRGCFHLVRRFRWQVYAPSRLLPFGGGRR